MWLGTQSIAPWPPGNLEDEYIGCPFWILFGPKRSVVPHWAFFVVFFGGLSDSESLELLLFGFVAGMATTRRPKMASPGKNVFFFVFNLCLIIFGQNYTHFCGHGRCARSRRPRRSKMTLIITMILSGTHVDDDEHPRCRRSPFLI